MEWLTGQDLLLLYVFVARALDVSIGTMRTILMVRGCRVAAGALGFFEIMIWLTAVSGVLSDSLTIPKVLAYSSGFAAGNVLGIMLEQKLAFGSQLIRLSSPRRNGAVAAGLRLAGLPVTQMAGWGEHGEVSLCQVIVPRAKTPQVLRIACRIDEDLAYSVEDLRQASLVPLPSPSAGSGWRAILKKK